MPVSRQLAVIALLLAVQPAWGDERPEKAPGALGRPGALILYSAHADFGERYQSDTVEWEWRLENLGSESIEIEEALSLEGDAELSGAPATLAPGESTTIRVRQPLQSLLGLSSRRYALITDEPGVARYRFSLSGFVESAFEPEIPVAAFGVVRHAGATAMVEVSSREVEALTLVPTSELPPFLDVGVAAHEADPQTVRLELRLEPAVAPLGGHGGQVFFDTNVPTQPRVAVHYRFTNYADVVPEANPLMLEPVDAGTSASGAFRLRGSEPFEVVGVQSEFEIDRLEATPCDGPAPATCWTVAFDTIPLVAGPFGGDVLIEVGGEERPLRVTLTGIAVSPGAPIRTIEVPAAEGNS